MHEERKPVPCECRKCLHTWPGLYLPMGIKQAATLMRCLCCPMCGATAKEIHVAAELTDFKAAALR